MNDTDYSEKRMCRKSARCNNAQNIKSFAVFAIQRHIHGHHYTRQRVNELQTPGVQQHAVHAEHAEVAVMPAVTVAGVADQMMRYMLQVPADLPETAGYRRALHQRVA